MLWSPIKWLFKRGKINSLENIFKFSWIKNNFPLNIVQFQSFYVVVLNILNAEIEMTDFGKCFQYGVQYSIVYCNVIYSIPMVKYSRSEKSRLSEFSVIFCFS